MFGLITKILLFAIGQKLGESHNTHEPSVKTKLVAPVIFGVMSLVFFAQGIAALLVAGFFGFEALGLANYYAALAVAGIALVISLSFVLITKCILSCCREEETRSRGFDPKILVSAFLEGLLNKNSCGRKSSYSGENVRKFGRRY